MKVEKLYKYNVYKYEKLKISRQYDQYKYYCPEGDKKFIDTILAPNYKEALYKAREWAKSKGIGTRAVKVRKVYDYMR